ncbi:MAG: signal peptidase I [Nitrospinota bacterium]
MAKLRKRVETAPEDKAPLTPAKKKSLIREYAEAIIIALVLALVVRTFVVQAFKIPSGSMENTLLVGDHILVNKFIYWFRDPKRGDIVVFKFPRDESRDFIKRVIGLPGEVVEVRGRQVLIDGRPLKEPYAVYNRLGLQGMFSGREEFGPFRVPEGSLFVMGDNRDNSLDSRAWGPLKIKKVKGVAFLIYWSWNSEGGWVRWGRLGKIIR